MPSTNHFSQKDLRKELRRAATYCERILWMQLKGCQLDGRRFRRQFGIASYIVDFYCPEEKLIVELDGDVHEVASIRQNDREREAKLISWGYRVLRFTNEEVVGDCDDVIERIRASWRGRERQYVPKHRDIVDQLPLLRSTRGAQCERRRGAGHRRGPGGGGRLIVQARR